MAATGSNRTERHLAQPPRSFRAAVARSARLQCSLLGAAVMLVVVLCLLTALFSSSPAEAATLEPAAEPTVTLSPAVAGQNAPIVPILFAV